MASKKKLLELFELAREDGRQQRGIISGGWWPL